MIRKYIQNAKIIITFILPIILGQLSQVLVDAENIYLAAKDSLDTLAIVGIAEGLSYPLFVMGLGMHYGISPLLAKFSGQNKNITHFSFSIFSYSCLLGGIFIGISFFLPVLVTHLNYEPKLVPSIQDYLFWLILSYPFAYIYQGLREFLQAQEKVVLANSLSLLSIFLNIVLNWVLLFHLKLGPTSLAIGTFLIRLFMCLGLVISCFPSLTKTKINFSFLKSSFYFCFPIGLSVLVEESSFSLLAALSGTFSELQEDAEDVVMTISNISFMLTLAISSATSTLVGHAFGQGRRDDLKLQSQTGLGLITFFGVSFALLIIVFPNFFIGLFTDDPTVFPIAKKLLIIAGVYIVIDAIQGGIAGILRGLGKTREVFYYFLTSFWLIGIPIGLFCAYILKMQTYGLWCGLLVSNLLLLLLCWRLFRKQYL